MRCFVLCSFVISIENTHDQLFHGLHFIAFAGGDQQSERSQCFIAEDGVAVRIEKEFVSFQKQQETRGSDALVAVHKCVVFYDELQQHGGFFLDTRVDILFAKRLFNLA